MFIILRDDWVREGIIINKVFDNKVRFLLKFVVMLFLKGIVFFGGGIWFVVFCFGVLCYVF